MKKKKKKKKKEMERKDDAESNWNKLTTSYHSVFSREYRSTPQIHANDSSSSAVGARRITKKPPSKEASPFLSDRASALGNDTSDIEKRYVPRLDFGEAVESGHGALRSARLPSSSSVTRSSASTGKKLPSRPHTARDSGRERRILRGTPKQAATRDQVSGKHTTSSRGHLHPTRQDAGDVYPRESIKDPRELRDSEIPSSVRVSGKGSVRVSGHTTPGRSTGNGSKNAHATTTLTSASNAELVFSARGFHPSHHTQREASGSLPRPRSSSQYETPRDGGLAKPAAYPPRATTPLFSHMPRVGSSSAKRRGKEYEREGVQKGYPDEHASSSLRNDAGSTFMAGTSSNATPLEEAHRSAFSFSSVRATDAVDGSSRAARPTRDDAAKSDGPSRSGKKKTPIISASTLRSPQPKMDGVCDDSGSVLFSADECIKPKVFAPPVSTSPSQPHPNVESTGGPREVGVRTVQRHAQSARSTASSGTSFSFLSQRKNVKEKDLYDEALQEDAKRVSFYDSTEKKSVRNGRENTRPTSQRKEEMDGETSTSGAVEGGEEEKEERSMVYSRVVESIVDDDAGKFGNRYADGDDPNGGNRTKYYVMPTATIDERLEYLSTLDERRWRREHGRAMKEEGVARRPETLIVTRYGPLKTLTYDGENSVPRAIMAPRRASSTTPHPASFSHGGKELSSAPVLGGANARESVKHSAYRAGASETVDPTRGSSHRESSRIRPITPIPSSNRRPLGDVMAIDKD